MEVLPSPQLDLGLPAPRPQPPDTGPEHFRAPWMNQAGLPPNLILGQHASQAASHFLGESPDLFLPKHPQQSVKSFDGPAIPAHRNKDGNAETDDQLQGESEILPSDQRDLA